MPINFGLIRPVAMTSQPNILGQAPVAPLPQPQQSSDDSGGLGDFFSGLKGLFGGMGKTTSPGGSGEALNGINPASSMQQKQNLTGPTNNQGFGLANQAGLTFQPGVSANGLNPDLLGKVSNVMSDLRAMGYKPVIASGNRTVEEQKQKVAQGYSHTMNSNHIGGGAVDIVDARYLWNDKKYGKEISQYAKDFAQVAEKHGLMTGIGWKSYGANGDFAHLQFNKKKGQNSSTSAPNQPFQPSVQNSHPDLQKTMQGIAYVESRDSKNPYTLMSKPTGKDRAYGKYQIMGTNIPNWTKAATGRSMTKEEFLADPAAQERTAAYIINQNLNKYGNPDDAFSVWFSGRPVNKAGKARDSYGTTVPQYIKRAREGMDKAFGMSSNTKQPVNPYPPSGIQPPAIPKELYEDIIRQLDGGRDDYASNRGTGQVQFNNGQWTAPVNNFTIQHNVPTDQSRMPSIEENPNEFNSEATSRIAGNGIDWKLLNLLDRNSSKLG